MAAPTLHPRITAVCLDGLSRDLRDLLSHLHFSLVLTSLHEDIGEIDMDERVIYLDAESSLAEHTQFLRECWSLCFIDPAAAPGLEPVTGRHLSVVRDS